MSGMNDTLLEDPYPRTREGKVYMGSSDNVVSKEKLRPIQYRTLMSIAETLKHTFGPNASNTCILEGTDANTLVAKYSKDGHKCLDHLLFQDPIEMSICSQLRDIVTHVDKEVGDGTTSATLLSAEIFRQLCIDEKANLYKNYTPAEIEDTFKKVVEDIKKIIYDNKRDMTVDDVFSIAMISTNGNEKVSSDLYNIYKKYGLDAYIELGISPMSENVIKEYDGMTLDEGFSDPAYINTIDGKSSIRNAYIYAFQDPIDTPEMVNFLEKIIMTNIMQPAMESRMNDIVPTVIISPKMSRDISEMVKQVVNFLKSYDAREMTTQKPPLLIITNLGMNTERYYDIAELCGCKMIKKYIDFEIQKHDVEKNLAPSMDTICSFFGESELVEADGFFTKFVNPKNMYEKDEEGIIKVDENGNPVPTVVFTKLCKAIEDLIEQSKKNTLDATTTHRLKMRLQSLKSNMIEYLVGGISISDRDAVKDLLNDAVKSCRSAYKDGVGIGANFEGLRACFKLDDFEEETSRLYTYMLGSIFRAYKTVFNYLYSDDNASDEAITEDSVKNLRTGKYDNSVITSIMTDINILDAIAAIVTLMFTTEQCFVQAPQVNTY